MVQIANAKVEGTCVHMLVCFVCVVIAIVIIIQHYALNNNLPRYLMAYFSLISADGIYDFISYLLTYKFYNSIHIHNSPLIAFHREKHP